MSPVPKALQKQVIQALREVYDPELPVNIYDLGLIYDIKWDIQTKTISILMTLTTPSCPAAEMIPANVKKALLVLPNVKQVIVDITFDPPYTTDRLSPEARLALGWKVT